MSFDNPLQKNARTRLQSVDLLRGAVMVLMAIDHVRVYSGLPAGGPSPGIFFTRWITHFCAPAFVFFAGTSAFLYGVKINDKGRLARYLVTRGLMLVLLELTLIRFSWTFNFDYASFTLAGVIWMLGWCMVLLSAFIRLRPAIAGFTGIAIIAFQQAFQLLPKALPQDLREPFGRFWEFIYSSGLEGPPGITILYVLVPWIGVMAAGYGFGAILTMEPAKRRKICWWTGLSSVLLFLIIGSIILLQQSSPQDAPPFIFRLLNQQKYPPSQLYLLMTLGPVIALIPFAERAKGWLAKVFILFGRVPFFYYLLHIPVIHISALIANFIRKEITGYEWYATAPYTRMPEEYRWELWLLYLLFVTDVMILYFICRWYAGYKSSHPEKKWLKYL
jgi:uncharacterized membrane protein